MTKLYWVYLLPVFARIMGCIGVLLALFACYIYIQFYNYDRCKYYSNTYHKWFTDAIDVDKYTQRAGRLIAKDAQYVIDNPNFRDILDNIFKV